MEGQDAPAVGLEVLAENGRFSSQELGSVGAKVLSIVVGFNRRTRECEE